MAKRTCAQCATAIPWGTPQCPGCGAWTIWRSRLANFGILVGAGTVVAVVLSLGRIYLLPPPAPLRANTAVERFLAQIAQTPDMRPLVEGGGRCRDAPASTLCVQMRPAFLDLTDEQRAAVNLTLSELWIAFAPSGESKPAIVLITPNGQIVG